MVTQEQVQELADDIARKFKPEKIILFGSYAYGKPTPDSDVDLLVLLPFEGKPWKTAAMIRSQIRPKFPLDLLARTSQQLQARIEMEDFFMREISERGQILYAGNHR
jgi:predicted nucleotidyltransferase